MHPDGRQSCFLRTISCRQSLGTHQLERLSVLKVLHKTLPLSGCGQDPITATDQALPSLAGTAPTAWRSASARSVCNLMHCVALDLRQGRCATASTLWHFGSAQTGARTQPLSGTVPQPCLCAVASTLWRCG